PTISGWDKAKQIAVRYKLRRMIEMIDMLPHMLPREIEEPFVFDRIKMLPRELTVTADDKK
ncbi:MAG TPA: hypothetical protein PLA41_02215, partial [Candidatus Pacearchaeota archaeon]|nr:hypothetical protein [Candidatus Pacearchaeota archaeon]